MSAGFLSAIYRHPVKSMMGECLGLSHLERRGIPGDRAWAVRDEERGGIRGAKRYPELMRCSARYDAEPPIDGSGRAVVTMPDGNELAIDDPSTADAIGALVGGRVSVWPLLPADLLDHYRRGAPLLEDQQAELRRIFARTAEEPLPALGDFPPELFEFESPPGTYFDAFPLLLMSTEGLAHLQALAPDQRFDVRRFRPNLLIETTTGEAFPERAWIGRRLSIGGAVLDIVMDCPRCVMTTHGFAELPRDPRIMRTLVRHADGNLGVYAKVAEPGAVRVGDRAVLLD